MQQALAVDQSEPGRLLIVEDDEPSRRLMRDIFAKHGYCVTEAVDGEDALRAVGSAPPDVILLDIMLPKLDGVEVCRRIKTDSRTAPIPVLLVTALHEREDRIRAIASGANDFITKPVDTDEVLLRVLNALSLKRVIDQRDRLLRLRDDLSDMVVHDIRNPLVAIMLTAKQLAAKHNLAATQNLAKEILGQVSLIDQFIDDLIGISQMEQGALKLHLTSVDLAELVRTALENHCQQAEQKKIDLLLATPDVCCQAQVDKGLFSRVLGNLLANAIKFSPANSTVSVRILASNNGQPPKRIVIEDEGPGVPLHFREHIFDKYSCLDVKGATGRQTGLGLAFCRLAAEAHGGRVYVTERQPGGSAFTVEIP